MGFFAVLAASLFAVFIFTVFGGYSLLLWCQQSLWMVVPPRWCWPFWSGHF